MKDIDNTKEPVAQQDSTAKVGTASSQEDVWQGVSAVATAPTPRTDAFQLSECIDFRSYAKLWDFARTLERELTAVTAENLNLVQLKNQYVQRNDELSEWRDKYAQWNDELSERCDKFKWQVRDTCVRAEKAEADRDAAQEVINSARKLAKACNYAVGTTKNKGLGNYLADALSAYDAAREDKQ